MTDLVSLLFIAMIPINCKITKFSLHLLYVISPQLFYPVVETERFLNAKKKQRLNSITWNGNGIFFVHYWILFHQERQRQPEAAFQSCALSHKYTMSQFNSWVAGATVSFLPKETQQQPGIDPGHRTWSLTITRPMPQPLSYYCRLL